MSLSKIVNGFWKTLDLEALKLRPNCKVQPIGRFPRFPVDRKSEIQSKRTDRREVPNTHTDTLTQIAGTHVAITKEHRPRVEESLKGKVVSNAIAQLRTAELRPPE